MKQPATFASIDTRLVELRQTIDDLSKTIDDLNTTVADLSGTVVDLEHQHSIIRQSTLEVVMDIVSACVPSMSSKRRAGHTSWIRLIALGVVFKNVRQNQWWATHANSDTHPGKIDYRVAVFKARKSIEAMGFNARVEFETTTFGNVMSDDLREHIAQRASDAGFDLRQYMR